MKDPEIRKSFDQIEPRTGAKERMYQNIMKKAENSEMNERSEQLQKAKKTTVIPMRFIRIAVPAVACLCIAVFGIMRLMPTDPSISTPEPPLDLYTPYETVESAEDFQKIGISIDAPDGAENIAYAVIDGNIANIDFSLGENNYFVRASGQSGDFSGVSGDVLSSDQLDSKTNAVLYQIDCAPDVFWKVSWTDGRIHYFLSNTDGASADEVKAVALLLIAQTQS